MPSVYTTGDGTELKLLPFKAGVIEELLTRAEAISGEQNPRRVLAEQIEMLAIGLKRGNPEVTSAWVRDNLDAGDIAPLFEAMMKAGGARTVKPGEGRRP